MKKLMLFLCLLLLVCPVQAKKRGALPVEVTLSDGAVVKGYCATDLSVARGKVKVSLTEGGSAREYAAREIRRLVFHDASGEKSVVFEPVTVGKGEASKAEPVLMQLAYDGSHARCFVVGQAQRSVEGYNGTMTTKRKVHYYYQADGMLSARQYYIAHDGIDLGRTAQLKRAFSQYPDLLRAIDADHNFSKRFGDDPTVVVKLLDSLLGKSDDWQESI